ncbi:MAG: DUF4157 domain-containing protein [Alphaproteobacteria bacterium]|nr:DUF4157 domain-containing protein [Alphaproteobacteria bacterium]
MSGSRDAYARRASGPRASERRPTVEAAQAVDAPDVEALVHEALHSTWGNQLVQAALSGADLDGVGPVLAGEIAAASAGLGASSEDGTGLLATGNTALAQAVKRAQAETLSTGEALATLRGGGGQQLPSGVRAQMEQAFGRSFAGVRVHTDTAQAAATLGAEAVAMGSHLHFAEGAYAPGSAAGRAVIAHELTHVVQAEEGRLPGVGGVSTTGMATEREAYANESLAMPGVQLASGVDTAIAPSSLPDVSFGAPVGAALGIGGFASGFGASGLAPLAGAAADMGFSGGPVGADSSAPAMLRESEDVDREESDTEASARHEVAMGLDQGFRRSIDMSQGDQTVNVAKEGTGRKDGIFTGPAANGHLAVDEYNAVMRDIGPDGESRSSGADTNLTDSAQNTQTENDGHVHLDGSPKLGATPETTATAPGGDPVLGGDTGGMVADAAHSTGGAPQADTAASKPQQDRSISGNPAVDAALQASFGKDLSAVGVHTDDPGNRALNARAFTQGRDIAVRGDVDVSDAGDKDAMRTLGHEMAHAVHGGGTGQHAVDQPGDGGEAIAERAGEAFSRFMEGGMKGPVPRLSAATGGKARKHREEDPETPPPPPPKETATPAAPVQATATPTAAPTETATPAAAPETATPAAAPAPVTSTAPPAAVTPPAVVAPTAAPDAGTGVVTPGSAGPDTATPGQTNAGPDTTTPGQDEAATRGLTPGQAEQPTATPAERPSLAAVGQNTDALAKTIAEMPADQRAAYLKGEGGEALRGVLAGRRQAHPAHRGTRSAARRDGGGRRPGLRPRAGRALHARCHGLDQGREGRAARRRDRGRDHEARP